VDFFLIFNILIIGGLPVFSFIFLRRRAYELAHEDFKTKFDSLYTNVETYRKTDHGRNVPYYYMTLFCVIRIVLAYTTVYWSDYIIIN